MSTESFEYSIKVMRENLAGMYANGHMTKWGDIDTSVDLDQIEAAHDRAIRDVSQQEYNRGFHAGQHSMDAEHRAVAMRLRGLRFDGGSHENLARIAYAIYPCATGWTCESADGLRDELVRLMGGVSDDTCDSQCRGACAAGDGGDSGEQEVSDGGTADDCGADTRCGDSGGGVHMAGVTDELRECVYTATKTYDDTPWHEMDGDSNADHTICYVAEGELLRIADRIDAQFDRICQQQEAVLQKTIDGMVKEYEHDRESDQLRIEKLEKQRDHWRQQATDMMNHADAMEHECDNLLDLLRDAREEYVRLRAKLDEHRGTVHLDALSDANIGETVERLRIEKLVRQRDEARARTDELSDELLRTRRKRDEARDECDRLKRDMLDKWVPRTSYEEKVEKYRRAYMESDAWRKSLQEKLNEYDGTHVELPSDANGNVFRVGCTVRILWRNPRVLLTVYDMTMCQDGEWMILAGDGDGYSCNLKTSSYEVCNDVCHDNNDTAESIVRDLSMGSITESQAVERISALNDNDKR